jgi:hypothetical protein
MAQWASIIGSPTLFLLNLSLIYALVPVACQLQRSDALHIANGVSLTLTLLAAGLGWRAMRRSEIVPPAAGDGTGQARFLAQLGVAISAICALAIALQWLTQWFIAPCVA